MKMYCLSGLGVDQRAFQNINPKGIELIHIEWIEPLTDETLEQYSKRLFDKIQPEDNYKLIGVSFGGMIAIEFSKIKKPSKLFLVSTLISRKELSIIFKLGSMLKIHKLIPTSLLKKSNYFTNYLFGINDELDKKLLKEILNDTDPKFLKWAINAIVNWDNTLNIDGIRIHGTNDKILPISSSNLIKIDQGGHFMIVNKGKEITNIIERNDA